MVILVHFAGHRKWTRIVIGELWEALIHLDFDSYIVLLWPYYFIIIFEKLCYCITNYVGIFKWYKWFSNEYLVFLLDISLSCFQNNFSDRLFWRDFLVMVANFDSGVLRAFLRRIFWYGEYWFVAERDFGLNENLFTLLLVYKPGFEMVCDACMPMYIVYIWHFLLWVFALSVTNFDYLIHILNVRFKIWDDKPTKSDFTLILNILKIKIVLIYTKSQVL